MQKPLSNIAVIRLPNRSVLINNLVQIANCILEKFSEVEEIILFGSLARGDYGTYSDADVLLILSESPYQRYFDRIPKYAPVFLDFFMPVDIFPYTRNEINIMLEKGNLFIKSIFDDCISLAKRENA
ncbi:MAG: nucleotidyltransferase domain-containing protein [bacterium]